MATKRTCTCNRMLRLTDQVDRLAALLQHGDGGGVVDVLHAHAVHTQHAVVHPATRDVMTQSLQHCQLSTRDDGTHRSFPSAGPPPMTSEMAMEGSPFAKCGLSMPPLTAMPKP